MSDIISFLDSASNDGVITQGTFSDTTVNNGTVEIATFDGTASNEGSVQEAVFTGSASNLGTVDTAVFVGSASNEGSVAEASFAESASNEGTVTTASFSDTAVNEGTATSAVFSDGAVNIGSLTSGTFLGTAVNSGVVTVAEFFGTASNVGFIIEAAKFADTSSNVGTVSGSAIFADYSTSDGVVEGAVQLGVNVTEGENQALTEEATVYTQTDGFFPNAHYSSGSKAAPANYATVVHQVGSFWYKYDGNGDGTLASGNYSDGTSLFTFAMGVKGAAYVNRIFVQGAVNTYLYFSDVTFANGTILYYDISLTSVVDFLTSQSVGDISTPADGYIDSIETDGSGAVIITYGQSTNDPDGTFIRTETLYITINGTQYENGTKDIVADGNGGERDGNSNYPADGTSFVTETLYITINGTQYENGTKDIVADGNGGERDGSNNYPAENSVFGDVDLVVDGYTLGNTEYLANGSGSYTESTTYVPDNTNVGAMDQFGFLNSIGYLIGTRDVLSNGSGGYKTADSVNYVQLGAVVGTVINTIDINVIGGNVVATVNNGTRNVNHTGDGNVNYGDYNYEPDGTLIYTAVYAETTYNFYSNGTGGYTYTSE